MTSVKIKFRPSHVSHKEGVLYIQLIHERKVKQITTHFRLLPTEWDRKKETIIVDLNRTERCPYLIEIKKGLEKEMTFLNNLIDLLERRGSYTVDELFSFYRSRVLNGFFFVFMDYRIKQLIQKGQEKTASIYKTAMKSFRTFLEGEDIRIEKIESKRMEQYESWLKKKGVVPNSSSCYMRVLRAVYNRAVQEGLATQNYPFRNVYTGIGRTAKRAVDKSVMIHLKDLDLSTHKRLAFSRDLFLFSFYTRGMSFVDMAHLKKSNIKNGMLYYTRSKTKQNLVIKVEESIQEIIDRYSRLTRNSDWLLPILYTEKDNYSSALRKYNKRLKDISRLLKLDPPLTSYVSRHSWASLAKRTGIPIQVISEGMGHENEKTTRIYLASLDQNLIDQANSQVISLI